MPRVGFILYDTQCKAKIVIKDHSHFLIVSDGNFIAILLFVKLPLLDVTLTTVKRTQVALDNRYALRSKKELRFIKSKISVSH